MKFKLIKSYDKILNTLMKPNIDSYVVITVHIFSFITLYSVYMR